MTDNSIQCREIETSDVDAVVDLLTRGYGDQRTQAFWATALDRLARHDTPPGLPKFGYMLDAGGTAVGVILLIFSRVAGADGEEIRGNVSSWYVDEAYRPYGTMLISRALRHKQATYLNVTPAPHTWPILKAQGYRQYCAGRMMTFPWLSAHFGGARISRYDPASPPAGITPTERQLLAAHASYGCICLIADAGDGAHPFVFAPRVKHGVVSLAFLIYCRSFDEFRRFAPGLGRAMLRRLYPMIVVDADGKVAGLPGRYTAGHPKFVRGQSQPRLGDLAYTERAMFGV